MSTNREARYKRLAQEARRREKRATEALEQAVAEIEALEARPDASEVLQELETLHAQIREGAARAAFDEAAKAQGVPDEWLDDLWRLDPLDPGDGDEDLDPKAVAAHVRDALKGREERFTRPADGTGDGGADGADSDGDEGPDAGAFRDAPRNVFDLAPKVRDKTPGKGDPPRAAGGEKPAAKGSDKAPAPAGKLSRGEGAGRGGRDDHRTQTLADVVDADFAATGRTDAFKI